MTQCQQKELEDLRNEVAALKKQLQQTQRMTALGELVSTTTGDTSPLSMSGASSTMVRKGKSL